MRFFQNFLPENHTTNTHKNFKEGRADSITIHWTGPFPEQSPWNIYNWFERVGNEASAHFCIKNDVCMQFVPIHRTAWHCGHPVGNATSIAIEVIPANKSGDFSQASKKTLKELLSILPPLPLVRHHDWSGKDCPAAYLTPEKWKQLCLEISPEI